MSRRRPTRSGIGARRKRREDPVKFRLHRPEWVDPFPWILGTRPEKMIFEVLVRRGIFFIFQGDFPKADRDADPLLQDTNFKPDIIIPEWKVILDPFGDFHHSLPAAVERDKTKMVLFEAMGYEFVHPWSSEIDANGGEWAVNQSQRLAGPPLFPLLDAQDRVAKASLGYRLGDHIGLGVGGVAAANRKRAKPKSPGFRTAR